MGSSFLRYTLLRIALFGACLATVALLGWWSLEGMVAAILLSAVLSWFFLKAPREQLAADIETRVEGRAHGGGATKASSWDIDAAAEDSELDGTSAQGRRG